jgi:hypothetical protein
VPGGDPRSARQTVLADLQSGQAVLQAETVAEAAKFLATIAKKNAALDATAKKGRASVQAADLAAAQARAEAEAAQEGGGEAPPDITQLYPQSPINAASPQPGAQPSFGELFERGGSANAIANGVVAPARQQAGTLPSRQPSAQPAQGGGGMSVNVGGQTFSAPDTLTTTRTQTGPQEFSPGWLFNATTHETMTEPNALRARDILEAQQRRQATIGTTLFELGREGVIGPDAVTAAMAIDRGDYATWGRVLEKNPLLSQRVTEKNMEVLDRKMDLLGVQMQQAAEATRGQKLLNDYYAQQFGALAEGAGGVSLNDIYGIAAPTPQGLGEPVGAPPATLRGALGGSGSGGLTPNQVLGHIGRIKFDDDGKLDGASQSRLEAMAGWGISNGTAVFATPKRGTANDFMRGIGMDVGSSNVQMIPLDEVIGTVLAAHAGDETQIARLVDEWGLFKRGKEPGSFAVLDAGAPNARLSRGLRRHLRLILKAEEAGAEPQLPKSTLAPVEVPTPDALDAEADVELERTNIKKMLTNPQLSEAEKGKLRMRLAELAGPDKGLEAVKRGVKATGEAFGRARERSAAEAAEARKYLGTLE